MKPLAECYDCLKKLINQAAALATDDYDLQQKTVSAAQSVLDDLFKHNIPPADIATIFHRKIKSVSSNSDPFQQFKRREIEQANAFFETLKGEITPDLENLLKFSVKGNALDFFRSKEEISKDFHNNINFTINHTEMLKNQLKPGRSLLFLADNAGECYFDLPLISFLSDCGVKVVYIVKGLPSQNDITAKDLDFSGLSAAFPKVLDNGSDAVGLKLAETSELFQKTFYESDIIIAKGMGHYETLCDNTDKRLFFFLKAKCRPVAKSLGVTHGSYVLKNTGAQI